MPAQRIRVLLIGISAMLGEIVTAALAEDTDLEAIADLHSPSLPASVAHHRPQVVITGRFDGDDITLLWSAPRIQVYVLAEGGRVVRRVALAPARDELGELSLTELVAAIKSGQCRDAPDRTDAG
jgi:hypothetical protein